MASKSDQLFQKRKAKRKPELERRRATLSRKKRVLIVCEGEKAEPSYFCSLIDCLDLRTAEVQVCADSGSAPISVVEFGIRILNVDSDFDQIYFVFDKDSHASYASALSRVKNLRKKRTYNNKSISAITSNPCFEVWFLMHYQAYTRPITAAGGRSACENVIRVLKKFPEFYNYNKGNRNLFELSVGRLEEAKQNSEQVLKLCEASGTSIHYGNPTTLVHKLISALQLLANGQ